MQVVICNLLNDLNIADIIQSIAAVVAIPAAIIGFFKLFKKNKEIQLQISALKDLAEQSVKQTELMSNQNRLLQKDVELKENKFEIENYERKSSENKRKQEIKPRIEIVNHLNDDIFMIYNKGESIIIKDVKYNEGNEVIINDLLGLEINKEDKSKFKIVSQNPATRVKFCNVNIEFIVSDIEGNLYSVEWIGNKTIPKIKNTKEVISCT